jgi:hypothetical protein
MVSIRIVGGGPAWDDSGRQSLRLRCYQLAVRLYDGVDVRRVGNSTQP